MKYVYMLIASLIVSANILNAQPVTWNWASGVGGNLISTGNIDIGRDNQGNIYMAGDFTGTKTFGSITLTANSNNQVFVAKFNSSGTVLWAIKAGASFSPSFIGGLAVSNGELFVAGNFSSSITCGTVTQFSGGQSDVFLMKLDPATGSCYWIEKAGGSFQDGSYELKPAIGGGVIMTGAFTGTATFGTSTITNSSNFDSNVFMARYLDNGSCSFAVKVGGGNLSESYGICQDNSGNIIVTGYYMVTSTFTSGPVLTSEGASDVFLAKYDSTGILTWARSAGGEFPDIGKGVGVDQFGDIYLAGNLFSDTAQFGQFEIYDYGNGNLFLAKYSSSGNVLFAKSEGGNQNESIYGLSTDPLGGNYLTGTFNGNAILGGTVLFGGINDILIAKYDHTGLFRWAIKAGSTGTDVGSTILADASGFCNVAGHFFGTVTFGSTSLTSVPGEWSVYVGRLGGGTVGIEENAVNHFSSYPNPANNIITLNLEKFTDAIFTVELMGIDGKLIKTCTLTQNDNLSQYSIDISTLSSGNYLVKIYSSQGEFVKKIVVAD